MGFTVAGLGLVVFVFVAVLMLAHGLETALVSTGTSENAIVLRKGASTEMASGVYRDQTQILRALPEVASEQGGQGRAAAELVVLLNLRKRGAAAPANVMLRAVTPESLTLRPQVRLTAGRMLHPGTTEIITGAQIARRFQHAGLGDTLRLGKRDWTVVGVFEAGGSAFESEIWGDADQMMAAYGREAFSSVTLRLPMPADLERLRARMESDPRLSSLQVKRERDYYEDKSGMMAAFIRLVGLALTLVFCIGAALGAAITMYGAVANRTAEIGMLRTLGFSPRTILAVFLTESLALGTAGWVAGVASASLLQSVTISTTNWGTFSELAFGFVLSPRIAAQGLLFGLVMALAGGFLPAMRASRLKIVDALAERAA